MELVRTVDQRVVKILEITGPRQFRKPLETDCPWYVTLAFVDNKARTKIGKRKIQFAASVHLAVGEPLYVWLSPENRMSLDITEAEDTGIFRERL